MAYETSGTRLYGVTARVTATGASAATGALLSCREVMLHAHGKVYVDRGDTPVAAATTSIPLEAGEKFHMRINDGDKLAFITDGGSVDVSYTKVL